MEKLKEQMAPNQIEKLLTDAKKYLRANAPQVKFILLDSQFTEEITTTEREDLGKKGYKESKYTFKNLEELKSHYGKSIKSTKDVTPTARVKSKRSKRAVKSKVAK